MARDQLRSIGMRILCIIRFELLSVANEHTLTDPLLRVTEVVAGLSQPEAMAFVKASNSENAVGHLANPAVPFFRTRISFDPIPIHGYASYGDQHWLFCKSKSKERA